MHQVREPRAARDRRIAPRCTPLIMSAAPPIASISTASHSVCDSPNPNIAAPQIAIATVTTTPLRRSLDTRPDNSPISSAPSGMPANNQPSAPSEPYVRSAISGNSAFGIPAIIAIMSTRNDTISTPCPLRYRRPATMSRSPADRVERSSGGIRGSRSTITNATASNTASIT